MKKPISQSKDILGGTPVFAGTRVPVQNLMDYLEAGQTIDAFLSDFPTVSRQTVIDTLEAMKHSILGSRDARAA